MPKSREVIYRPGRPERQAGPDWESFNPYLVTQGEQVLFAYYPCYYRTGDVVADMIARKDPGSVGLEGTDYGSMDFVVWHERRIMAVIHQRFDDEAGRFRVYRFDEEGNAPDYWEPVYGWPTRDEWVAAGRPDRLILTPEDIARNIARADAGKDIRSFPLDASDETDEPGPPADGEDD